MDLFWRENLICPTEPEYIEMVNNSELGIKRAALVSPEWRELTRCPSTETGGLFRISIKLMMAASPESPPRCVALCIVVPSFAFDSHAVLYITGTTCRWQISSESFSRSVTTT